jgi:hypothetical protein
VRRRGHRQKAASGTCFVTDRLLPRRYAGGSLFGAKLAAPVADDKGAHMASGSKGAFGGVSLGGVIVVAGVAVMIFGSFWIGLIITIVGLVAFGGFAKGKWY